MATVPIYIVKILADPDRGPYYTGIKNKDHYMATLLMPHAVQGVGLTPEEAKEDLRSQMVAILKDRGLIEIQNDTLEL